MSDLKNFNNFTMLKMFNLEEKHIENFSVYNVPVYKEDGKFKENILNIDVKLINQKTSCPVCTSEKYTIKGYVSKKLKHSVLKNQKCIINYKARRYKCGFCQKTFYEHNPFALGSMRYTMNTVYNVLRDLKSETETFASVAHRHDVSTNTVISIFDDYVEVTRSKLPEIICIDEVYAFKSRNSKYVCVLLDYRSQEVIDLLPSRILSSIGKEKLSILSLWWVKIIKRSQMRLLRIEINRLKRSNVMGMAIQIGNGSEIELCIR